MVSMERIVSINVINILTKSSWMLPACSPALALSGFHLHECQSWPYLTFFSLTRTRLQTDLLALKCQMHQWTLRAILDEYSSSKQVINSLIWSHLPFLTQNVDTLAFVLKRSWKPKKYLTFTWGSCLLADQGSGCWRGFLLGSSHRSAPPRLSCQTAETPAAQKAIGSELQDVKKKKKK